MKYLLFFAGFACGILGLLLLVTANGIANAGTGATFIVAALVGMAGGGIIEALQQLKR